MGGIRQEGRGERRREGLGKIAGEINPERRMEVGRYVVGGTRQKGRERARREGGREGEDMKWEE